MSVRASERAGERMSEKWGASGSVAQSVAVGGSVGGHSKKRDVVKKKKGFVAPPVAPSGSGRQMGF